MMELNIFAMPSATILLLLSAAFGISDALPWAGPEPTSVYKADEWSPVPTKIPVDPRELFKRSSVDVNVCGWVGGNKDNPAVCPTGSSCIHDWAHGYVGCCATTGSCTAGVYTSCVDRNSPGGITGPAVVNNGIFTCPSDSLCYKNSYPGNYFQWACGSTDQATKVETTFAGQPTDVLLQVVYTRMTFSPITNPSTTTTRSSSGSAIVSITSGSNSPNQTPNADPAKASASATGTTSPVEDNGGTKNKINGGIVAAGVIGTGAFIIALVGIAFFFLRRRKKQQEQQGSPGAGGGNGSFRSFKGGEVSRSPASTQATFPRAVAYSPDDFRTNASTNATSPPLDPARSVFSATEYQGIEQRLRDNPDLASTQPYYQSPSLNEDGVPRATEIANFADSFHAAIAQISPPNAPQAQMSNITPPSSRGYTSIGPEEGAGIAMAAITPRETRQESYSHGYGSNRGYGPVEDDDYGAQDSYMPGDDRQYIAAAADDDEWDEHIEEEDYGPIDPYDPTNKEMGVETGVATRVKAPPRYSPIPGFHPENVRAEGWEPTGLRPNRDLTPPTTASTMRDGMTRHQLTDAPPANGVRILHSPGQRGQAKANKQKQGYDGKNGDDLQA